jgi:ABC-type uncharacterized transport system permease subunit
MNWIFPTIAVFLYLAAAGLLLPKETALTKRFRLLALTLGMAAVIVHAMTHLQNGLMNAGMNLHFFAALSLVSMGMAALTSVTAFSQRIEALGLVVYPLAAIFVGLFGFAEHKIAEPMDWRITLHAWLALLAYATLAISSLLAIAQWLQERALHARTSGGWLRILPPLLQLEQLLFRSIAVGFVLLTAALLTGVLFVEDMLAQHLWHKTVFSVLSWAVFGGLLIGRWRYGWRGERAVRFTLIAMALLLLAFFGSKFVLELVLNR